jgi:hypothetical protein
MNTFVAKLSVLCLWCWKPTVRNVFAIILVALLPPSQIIRHSKNLEESKHLKFDQNYRNNYKDL